MILWPSFGFKLRSKLLLVSLVLVLLPWLGVHYIQAIEDLLQQEQSRSIATIAQATAVLVEQQPDVFRQRKAFHIKNASSIETAVVSFSTRILIDGYYDEWLPYKSLLQSFPAINQIFPVPKIDPQDISVRYILAQQDKYLIVLLDVVDDSIVFRDPSQHQRHGGDAIVVALVDKQQRVHRYMLSASAPGRINAYEYIGSYLEPIVLRRQTLIKAAWKISPYGYRLELKIPDLLMADMMALAVIDVDINGVEPQVIGLGDVRDSDLFSHLLLPAQELIPTIATMAKEGVRIWLVDNQMINMASAGLGNVVIEESGLNSLSDLFYGLFLTQPVSDDESLSHEQSVLSGQAVKAALAGEPQTERRTTNANSQAIIVAAHPIVVDNNVVGAIVVEKNTNTILALQNKAVKTLLNTTLFVFAVVIILLLGFASRLSFRIKRLNRDVSQAVNHEGRISGEFSGRVEMDELGELRQSFVQLFDRLGQYHHYLEALSSRLAHELRTPIAVIKTSLEHIQYHVDDKGQSYIERARSGSDRINDIVARMSEASRLEQSVNNIEFEVFNINQLLVDITPVYQDIYPDAEFIFEISDYIAMINGSKELLVQMLDKLISNAVDFHQKNTPVVIILENKQQTSLLRVRNTGELLPDEMKTQLFQPMVSIRKEVTKTTAPHLGLGLYIVKLVVESHKGSVTVDNWQQGVEFLIELPITKLSS